MWVFRFLFTETARLLRSEEGRRLLGLAVRYGDRPRNQAIDVTFGPYRFRVPDPLSFIWQYREIFVDEFYKFTTTSPNPVIFDCGTNIGTSVVYFRQNYPTARIVAFEADEHISEILQQNLRQNQISGVEVITKAVWTNEEGIWFGSDQADSASIFSQTDRKLVPSVRLRDALLRETRIDMLKMDIEGAETAVLTDCHDALAHVQNLFVEFHAYLDHPQTLADVMKVLEGSGFRYYINTSQYRHAPLVNQRYKGNDSMDLQLNIFAYRN
ncbi:FkbM family methyltransferase [Spirosoma sp. KCTC 42546]|uniref:FkbM family methyltransferase n=1 Tax=Spirosoma sp. KCTC 42546 TaxID=2520506 RepID=UPI001158E35A|nr:FkbM family methyltransferase [Spirosoma sp. KCTC 42546]QDK81853.1 FkbM family methyltransferase [Spirosoma sp. KCTC 42546]